MLQDLTNEELIHHTYVDHPHDLLARELANRLSVVIDLLHKRYASKDVMPDAVYEALYGKK